VDWGLEQKFILFNIYQSLLNHPFFLLVPYGIIIVQSITKKYGRVKMRVKIVLHKNKLNSEYMYTINLGEYYSFLNYPPKSHGVGLSPKAYSLSSFIIVQWGLWVKPGSNYLPIGVCGQPKPVPQVVYI